MRVHWLFSALAFCICFASGPPVLGEVKLLTPSGYLPGIPFLARVEVRNSAGARDWDLWDAEATLSTDQPNVLLSTNRVALKNGVGTALLSISGTGGFNLRAQVNGEVAARAVRDRSAESISHVQGLLAGASSRWSGIVRVIGTVTGS